MIDALLVGDGMLWTASAELRRLIGLPILGRMPGEHAVTLRGDCDDLACDAATLWMARERTLVARSAATGEPAGLLLDVPWRVDGLSAADGWLWAVHFDERGGPGEARCFAPSGKSRTFALPAGPHAVAAAGATAWVTSHAAGIVTRIDGAARDGEDGADALHSTRVGRRPWSVVADERGVWVARADGSIVRLDPAGSPAALADGGAAPVALALDGERLWAAGLSTGMVRELDAVTGLPRADAIELGRRVDAIAAAGGQAWALCADGIVLLAPTAPATEGDEAVGGGAARMLRLPRRRAPRPADEARQAAAPGEGGVATVEAAARSRSCPDCGAEVEPGARVCRRCRYRFETL